MTLTLQKKGLKVLRLLLMLTAKVIQALNSLY